MPIPIKSYADIDIQINSFYARPDRFHYARINRGSVYKNLLVNQNPAETCQVFGKNFSGQL